MGIATIEEAIAARDEAQAEMERARGVFEKETDAYAATLRRIWSALGGGERAGGSLRDLRKDVERLANRECGEALLRILRNEHGVAFLDVQIASQHTSITPVPEWLTMNLDELRRFMAAPRDDMPEMGVGDAAGGARLRLVP